MLLQRKKANSFVPAIFSPWHGLFRKKGGTGAGIRFYFPCDSLVGTQGEIIYVPRGAGLFEALRSGKFFVPLGHVKSPPPS